MSSSPEHVRATLAGYAAEAQRLGRYDFYTGPKLQSCLEAAGFQVNVVMLKSSKRGVGASIV